LLVLSLSSLQAMAASHWPVFGLATPTNSQGEWSLDQGIFDRITSLGSQASIRELLGYGITPHLTLSFTLPAVVVLIALSFVNTYYLLPRLRTQECSPDNPTGCAEASRLSKILLWLSAMIFAIGFAVAFFLGPILTKLDNL
jgi:hypothetical protein